MGGILESSKLHNDEWEGKKSGGKRRISVWDGNEWERMRV